MGSTLVEALPLLADPDSYSPFTFDYSKSTETPDRKVIDLSTWLDVFRASIPGFKRQAVKEAKDATDAEVRADNFERRFLAALEEIGSAPQGGLAGYAERAGYSEPNCASLCLVRDFCMKDSGFGDVFEIVKAEENANALRVLPGVLRELDALGNPDDRLELAVRGVFAGNIFDLGAAASQDLFDDQGSPFQATRQKLAPRPWPVDDFDRLHMRMRGRAYHKAVIFVDNAGSDVLLGVVPLARELLKRGTAIILAANETPTINDITAAELQALTPDLARLDPGVLGRSLNSGQLQVMSSGSGLPVIDLRRLSPEFCKAVGDADLVILEGMGRSIETNLRADFRCDALCLGMIKHPEVAALLAGELYGCVCRFTPADSQRAFWESLQPPPPEAPGSPNSSSEGEGPVWDPEAQALYWVDIPQPSVHRLCPETGAHSAVAVSDWVGCVCLPAGEAFRLGKRPLDSGEAVLVAAVGGDVVSLSIPPPAGGLGNLLPTAEVATIATLVEGSNIEEVCLNDGKPDPNGNFWLGTAPRPGSKKAAQAAAYRPIAGCKVPGALEVNPEGVPPPGRLYMVPRQDKGAKGPSEVKHVGPVTVSNGLGWSPDHSLMYYTDSMALCVRVFDYDLVTSAISGGRVFCGVPEHLARSDGVPVVPDGLTVDRSGGVWVAFWNGGAVGHFQGGTGELLSLLTLPVSRPTCPVFGGPELDVLYVTSCRQDKGEKSDLQDTEPLAGCLFAVHKTGARGLPPHRFQSAM